LIEEEAFRETAATTDWSEQWTTLRALLEADHYWVRRSFKIDVTQEEKRQVGKPFPTREPPKTAAAQRV
jgi:hypothetical protein